jgi:hypothetical protein
LHQLVLECGLEDAGPIVALATTAQLQKVFDDDLWRAERAGAAEEFDAERFGLWLEVLVEAGPALAARKLVEMDFDLVTAAFSRHLLVLDEQSIALEREGAEAIEEFGDHVLEEQLAQVVETLESDSIFEIAGFKVVARSGAPWDALTEILASMSSDHPAFLGRLLSRCGALAAEWIVDNGGLYEVLTTDEQILADVAGEREERRAQEGFVAPPEAAAFLRLARQRPDDEAPSPPWDHLTASYFRTLDARTSGLREETPARARVEAQRSGLLAAGEASAPERLATIRTLLLHAREHDAAAYARRTEELGYLANVLVAGCSFQSRRFRPVEAADAALATCNLGLESWPRGAGPELPPSFLVDHELVSVFRKGFRLLHERVCLEVARGLVEALAGLELADAALRRDVARLRARMTAQLEAGTPWRERENLDVLAILDPPTWAVLVGLVDECPVVPKPAPSGKPALRVASEFEFVSDPGQIAWARDFAAALARRLSG